VLFTVASANVPVPLTTVHKPVPTAGTLPAKVAVGKHTFWFAPATETEGLSKRVIVTVLMEGVAQEPLVIVQVKVVVPIGKLPTVVLATFALPNVTPTALLVQVPTPTVGELPAKVALSAHKVWFAPATEVEGVASLLIVTVLSLTAQPPFDIVHLKTFAPTLKLETPLLNKVASANVPVPLTTVHKPVPTAGTLPAKVAVGAHTFWFAPATETEGLSKRVIVMVLTEGVAQEPFVIVQVNTFAPIAKPLTALLNCVGLAIVAPEAVVQTPMPTLGLLPAKVALSAHKV
jgi:hypothetical protein